VSVVTRTHSARKGYISGILGILGINSGDWGQNMSNIGKSVSEAGDPMVTYG
jgi:hypothetical protein